MAMATLTSKRAAVFLAQLFGPVVAVIMAVASINAFVDPLWTLPYTSGRESLRYCVRDERQNKINRVIHGGINADAVLIGSSRSAFVDAAFFGNNRVLNMSANGLTPIEYPEFVRIFREHHGTPAVIYVGFDFFSYAASQLDEGQVDGIRLRETASASFFYALEKLLDPSVLLYSLDTLDCPVDPHAAVYLYDGARRVERSGDGEGHRLFVSQQVDEIAKIFDPGKFKPDPAFEAHLARLSAAAAGSRLVVYVPPVSSRLLKAEMARGHLDDYLAWMHGLVKQFGSVVHFNGVNHFTTDAGNYFDSHHVYADLTAPIAEALEVNHQADDGFGLLITEESFPVFAHNFREEMARLIGDQ
jgi:hypothetical protein